MSAHTDLSQKLLLHGFDGMVDGVSIAPWVTQQAVVRPTQWYLHMQTVTDGLPVIQYHGQHACVGLAEVSMTYWVMICYVHDTGSYAPLRGTSARRPIMQPVCDGLAGMMQNTCMMYDVIRISAP